MDIIIDGFGKRLAVSNRIISWEQVGKDKSEISVLVDGSFVTLSFGSREASDKAIETLDEILRSYVNVSQKRKTRRLYHL